jgi:hypothetical protein
MSLGMIEASREGNRRWKEGVEVDEEPPEAAPG